MFLPSPGALKDAKLKVDVAINGENLWVSGKKQAELQGPIAFLNKGEFVVLLTFENFRD